jgi:hypothetical protein
MYRKRIKLHAKFDENKEQNFGWGCKKYQTKIYKNAMEMY